MPAVSNTSPILNLAIIGQLDLLKDQFTKILIPPTVLQELRLDDDFPELVSIKNAIDEQWLQVVSLQNPQLAQILKLASSDGICGWVNEPSLRGIDWFNLAANL